LQAAFYAETVDSPEEVLILKSLEVHSHLLTLLRNSSLSCMTQKVASTASRLYSGELPLPELGDRDEKDRNLVRADRDAFEIELNYREESRQYSHMYHNLRGPSLTPTTTIT